MVGREKLKKWKDHLSAAHFVFQTTHFRDMGFCNLIERSKNCRVYRGVLKKIDLVQ